VQLECGQAGKGSVAADLAAVERHACDRVALAVQIECSVARDIQPRRVSQVIRTAQLEGTAHEVDGVRAGAESTGDQYLVRLADKQVASGLASQIRESYAQRVVRGADRSPRVQPQRASTEIGGVAGCAGDRSGAQGQSRVIRNPQQIGERHVAAAQGEAVILGGQVDRSRAADANGACPVFAADRYGARGHQVGQLGRGQVQVLKRIEGIQWGIQGNRPRRARWL